jgi:phage-related baseplate assembly protein
MEVAIKDIDRFLVGKVVHTIDESGRYSNRFTAYVADAGAVPIEAGAFPRTGPQIATVKENEDSKGRIKVQHQWQAGRGKTTNWIRVQTPDAGTSEKGARGSVFIPEIGDQVMVGFEYGDPNRPYVMGSLFPESIGTGGGAGNKNKSLTTRSGSSVKLDDETGDVVIVDQTGNNLITIDGTDKIEVKSVKTIELTNGKSSVKIEEEEITITAKTIHLVGEKEIKIESKSEVLTVATEGDLQGISADGKNISIMAKEAGVIDAKTSLSISSAELSSNGTGTNVIEGGIVKINS